MGERFAARPTVRDVAQAAGVSVGTVSNVLNRPETVGAARRDRVLHAISELQFVRNEGARALRLGNQFNSEENDT